MTVAHAQLLLQLLALYLGVGVFFALAFVVRGVTVVDPAARGSSVGFRLLILPGSVALWPLLAKRWWNARSAG